MAGTAFEMQRERVADAGSYRGGVSAPSKDDQGTEWLEQGELEQGRRRRGQRDMEAFQALEVLLIPS